MPYAVCGRPRGWTHQNEHPEEHWGDQRRGHTQLRVVEVADREKQHRVDGVAGGGETGDLRTAPARGAVG